MTHSDKKLEESSKPKTYGDKLFSVEEVIEAVNSCSYKLRCMTVVDIPALYDKLRGVEPQKTKQRKPPIR